MLSVRDTEPLHSDRKLLRFNSFTQELCSYDVVTTSRLQAAAEGHTGCSTDVMLTEAKHDNTQETVSYCGTFVNQIREIIDLLNNSGEILCAAPLVNKSGLLSIRKALVNVSETTPPVAAAHYASTSVNFTRVTSTTSSTSKSSIVIWSLQT